MGLNLALAFVNGRTEEVAGALGRRLGDELLTGDVAMSGSLRREPAVAQIQDWTLILDPGLALIQPGEPVGLTSFPTVISATIMEVSDSIMIEARRNGETRSVVAFEGQILVDLGEPIPEEHGLSWTEVDDVMVLLHRLTGVRLDSDEAFSATFRSLATLGNADDKV